ncbi:MAG TPA: CPXCG motif-containing cysteine-rich protein [bacterium]|nr:CPXCG motif-containing cysteine-rich protein [bacterium]
MNEELTVACPYCGETFVVEPEPADDPVEYVEDCHVCCRPILITVTYSEDGSDVVVARDDG